MLNPSYLFLPLRLSNKLTSFRDYNITAGRRTSVDTVFTLLLENDCSGLALGVVN